jgi:predicted ATP-dependent endonuclease of OLD family
MQLLSAKVGPFKSINSPQVVSIDPAVTVFVGMNEAGKTVFLQALQKSNDAQNLAKFNPIYDYPRKALTPYMKRHSNDPETAVDLEYKPSASEIAEVNKIVGCALKEGFTFSVSHKYNNEVSVGCTVDEKPVVAGLIKFAALSSDAALTLKNVTTIKGIPEALAQVALTASDQEFLNQIDARIKNSSWDGVVALEAWREFKKRIPKFVYFSEYDLLPGKVNLLDLQTRFNQAKNTPTILTSQHRAALALLRMADVSIEEFTAATPYEELKAKVESVSISLTDQIMEFWKQNPDLEVEVDIKSDPSDEAPFNNGPNLYLRIKNKRHRGVSTPFEQRSRGFVWFFSFLVWFDSVQQQLTLENPGSDAALILLLDEPGLALHALAQDDLLRYIDDLSKRHQVLYSTHSPFMVHSDRLHQVRMVEDKTDQGTTISSNLSSSDPKTIFPLQAALGWTIAQNLFISERNLLVEGPSELAYLKMMSANLEASGKAGLQDDVTIVPVGGLDKVVTFIALLGANGLKLAVLHDYHGSPEKALVEALKHKMVAAKAILNVSQFRDLAKIGTATQSSDIEDLFEINLYLEYFNKAYAAQLGKKTLKAADLPSGERIVDRIDRYLNDKSITLRPSGGFNHYLVASKFASEPPASFDNDTLDRFEAVFVAVNKLFN